MKKIYLFAMLLVMGFAANAQRNLVLNFTIIKPAYDTNIVTGSTLSYQYRVTNNSATAADSIQKGDTVKFFDPSCKYDATSTATIKFTGYVYFVATSSIAKGSSITVTPTTPLAFANIETLADLPGLTYTSKSFTNNKQYAWFLVPYQVSIPSTNISIGSVSGSSDTGRIWVNKVATGINEFSFEEKSINTYPNPAVNTLSFEHSFTNNENASARIMDAAGRTVFVKEFDNNNGTKKFDLDITSLQSGFYFLNFVVGDKTMVSKFNVQK